MRYGQHVFAFTYLVGEKFPGFVGREGSYGVDAHIDPPQRQSRWTIFFRGFLALPALLVSSALGGAAFVVGRARLVLRDRDAGGCRRAFGTSARPASATARRRARTGSCSTDRYPFAAPVLHDRPPAPADASADAAAPAAASAGPAPARGPRSEKSPSARSSPWRSRPARTSSTRPPSRTTSALGGRRRRVFGAELVARRGALRAVPLLLWVLAQVALVGHALPVREARGRVRAGVRGGADRNRDVARDARARDRWLVGLPFSLAAFWWARRYEQTEYGLPRVAARGLGPPRRRLLLDLASRCSS